MEDCTICVEPLKQEWQLPCRHKFHPICIVQWYRGTKNKFTNFCEPLKPVCPICRFEIHQKDLPPGYLRLRNQLGPIIEGPNGERVVRSRTQVPREERLITEEEYLEIWNELIARRNAERADRHTQRDSREDGPLSQDVQIIEVRPAANIAQLQREINIVREVLTQIEARETQRSRDAESEDRPSSPVSVFEEELECDARPVEVQASRGRGRNIRYLVLWSDGIRSFNKHDDVKQAIPDLLSAHQKRTRAENTRRWRRNKAAKIQ